MKNQSAHLENIETFQQVRSPPLFLYMKLM